MRCFAVGCLCRVIGALPPGHERRRGAPGCLLARACAAATLLNEQDNVFHWLVGTAPPPPPPPPPAVPILTVVVPVLTTDNLTWQCSSEAPARQCLTSRGLVPILAEGSAR